MNLVIDSDLSSCGPTTGPTSPRTIEDLSDAYSWLQGAIPHLLLVVSWKGVKVSMFQTKWLKSKNCWGIGVIVAFNDKEGETKNSNIEHIIIYT